MRPFTILAAVICYAAALVFIVQIANALSKPPPGIQTFGSSVFSEVAKEAAAEKAKLYAFFALQCFAAGTILLTTAAIADGHEKLSAYVRSNLPISGSSASSTPG